MQSSLITLPLIARAARVARGVILGLVAVTLLLAPFSIAHAASLTLTWTDASTNEDGFHVQRKTGTSGTYATLATVTAGTTGYVDGTVTAGTTYCYHVSAYNTAGDSAYSNEACATPASATLYTVAVTKSGAGSGTVASAPTGIDCGSTCGASFASQTSIALSATANAGSTFSGWSGACNGTGGCALVVDNNKSLTATFALSAPSTYALTLTKSGTGSGTVTSSPTGINCGATCSTSFNTGTSVTLTAAATTGSTFTGWSGACSGMGTCAVSMTAARSVTATFATSAPTTYTLTLTKVGTGSGTVTSAPTGINCGASCSTSFNSGASVTLTATATTGSTFTGWSGGGCSGTGNCVVTMSAAQNVTVTFATSAQTTYGLTVTKSGTGSGTVTSAPSGITCGSTCSTNFNSGTSVTLTAAASAGSTFTGWSGACTGTGTCTVSLTQAQSVTAAFVLQTYTLTVTKSGTGSGAVTSSPAGLSCGTTCSANFNSGTSVTLTAAATTGAAFTGWSGACAGTGTCAVTMSAARNVTATFATSAPTNYGLTVTKAGIGGGTVISNPTGITCGSTCSTAFTSGTTVTLTASAASGSVFTGWSGACAGSGATSTVTVDAAKIVTATFAPAASGSAGLVAAYNFNDGSGTTVADATGNGHNGTLVGATWTTNGKYGNALTFNGTSARVTVPDAADLDLTAGLTLEAWVYPTTAQSGWRTILHKETDRYYLLANSPQNTPAAGGTFAPGTQSTTFGTTTLPVNAWSHLAVTFDGTTVRLYVNSTQVASQAQTTALTTSTGALSIGGSVAYGEYFAGQIDEVRVYNRALIASELQADMNTPVGGTTPPPTTYALAVTKAGTGSGSVTSTPSGIDCGAACVATFNTGTSVTLTAAPDSGATFTGWSGACAGTGTCTMTMSAAQSVTATFALNTSSSYTLSVAKSGTGTGIVASNPAGINCGTTCSASYANGALVTLQALPDAGSTFTGWSGACTGTGNCTVTLSRAQSVTAGFALQRFTLTVAKAGTGSGTVKSTPTGINCGSSCSANFNSGANVTLTATPRWRSTFAGWSGACSGTGTCTVTLTQSKSVTATFTR